MLRIETSIAPPAGSLLVNTAQVHIRIYRAAPSLAESLSGSFARTKSTGNAGLPALNLKLLWQSAQLDDKAKGVVFVDVEVSARAVDAALKGSAVSSRAHLLQQVLQTLEKRHNVKLSSKSAQVSLQSAACMHAVCSQCQPFSMSSQGKSTGKHLERGGNDV